MRPDDPFMEYLDASIVVKWFKADEVLHEEALEILRKAGKDAGRYLASEWLILELVRAQVKAGINKEDIRASCSIMEALHLKGAITKIPFADAIDLARDLEIELGLHAADALHLAIAIKTGSRIFWTEDSHLRKKKVRDYAKGCGVKIRGLEFGPRSI
ncbi:MAG: type II toxin-antitoxin system VapC family toxin [Candidatus Altiarchaeota archaeon]|nr:type II toxin-antitoxin system VapC family toxin [Candidatus Altiarchaeota archaeon]